MTAFCFTRRVEKRATINHSKKFLSNQLRLQLFKTISHHSLLYLHLKFLMGIGINIRDTLGRNALYWAIKMDNLNAVKILIHLGINFNAEVEKGVSAQALAKKFANEDLNDYIEKLTIKLIP